MAPRDGVKKGGKKEKVLIIITTIQSTHSLIFFLGSECSKTTDVSIFLVAEGQSSSNYKARNGCNRSLEGLDL